MDKKCFKCGGVKPLDDFYKHKGMLDGRLNKCIECTRSDVKSRYKKKKEDPDWHEKEKARGREKYYRLKYRGKYKPDSESKTAAIRRYIEKFPEKRKAKTKSQRMKPRIKGNHLHHWSYNEEHYKDVVELSVADHNTLHRFIIYDQERMMYRKVSDGYLLYTRAEHLAYCLTLGLTLTENDIKTAKCVEDV